MAYASVVGCPVSAEWFHEQGALAFLLEIGPDDGPRRRPAPKLDRVELAPGIEGRTPRIEHGYQRPVESDLDRELDTLRARHAAYLLEVVEMLDGGRLD